MRAVLCLLSVCIIASFLISTAAAISVDGDIGTKEWYYADFCDVIIAGSESNCNVDYASMYSVVKKEDHSVFLAFKYTSVDFDIENNQSAVEIYTNGVYSTKVYADGRTDVDYDKFDVDCTFGFHEKFQETYCEMRLGIKYGVEDTTVLGIRIYDYQGRPSNYYEITVCEEETTVAETEATTEKESKTKKETTTTGTTAPSKSLSDYRTEPIEKGSMHVQSIRAETATLPESSTETTKETTTEQQTTKETETEAVHTTVKEKEESKTSEKTATTVIESEQQTQVSAVLIQEEVNKVNIKKFLGYGTATLLMLGAVIVAVVIIVVRMMSKKTEESQEDDF